MAYYYDGSNGFQPGGSPNKTDKDDVGSWVLIGIFFLTGLWPVGLILLISKLSDGSRRKKPRQTYASMGAGAGRAWDQASASAARAAEQAGNTVRGKMTKTPQYSSRGAGLMKVIGMVMLCLGLSVALGAFNQVFGSWEMISALIYGMGMGTGGIGLWVGSRGMMLRQRRFAKYAAIAGDDMAVPLEKFAGAVSVPVSKVVKDLEIMVEKNHWEPEAYVDLGSGMFFRTRQAAADYARQQEKPTSEPPEAEKGYSGILRDIHRSNDRIADPVLSQKIDRLEEVAGKIFRIIEAEPAKKEKAGTFLNYYLPTTQKLLDSYAEFEEAGISGENLDQAKEKIQKTMDAIVVGFERQLDQLYQVDAMDIESDIRVMETMLKRDGAHKDFDLGGMAAQQEDC